MKSKIDHRSPRLFSTGVPVSAMRARAFSACRHGSAGTGVLDRLRLVEDGQPPGRLRQRRHAQQRAVAGDHQVELQPLRRGEALDLRGRHRGRVQMRPAAPGRNARSPPPSWPAARRARPGGYGPVVRPSASRRSTSSSASTWIVLPSPMSSARQAPRPSPESRCSHRTPSLLVGPQTAVQRRAGIDAPSPSGHAQRAQRLGQPGPGGDLRPIGCDGVGRVLVADGRAGEQAHGLGEGRPSRAASARPRGSGRGCAEPLAVDLHPAAAQQHQVSVPASSRRDLGRGQRLAVERDVHAEVEQRRRGRAEGARPPTVAVTCGRGGRLARQPAGMRTTTPARFQIGGAGQQAQGLARAPAQRVEDLAAIDHRRSQSQASAARCTGSSRESSWSRFAAPPYSRSAWPSGTCCTRAWAESRVV